MDLVPFAEVPHHKSSCFHILSVIPFSQLTEVFFHPRITVLQHLLTQLSAHSETTPLLSINTTTSPVKAAVTTQHTGGPAFPSLLTPSALFPRDQPGWSLLKNKPSLCLNPLIALQSTPQCWRQKFKAFDVAYSI